MTGKGSGWRRSGYRKDDSCGGRAESSRPLQSRGGERRQCRRGRMRVAQALEANGTVDLISRSQALYDDSEFGMYGILARDESLARPRFQFTA